jgi:hypothetical protein
VYDKISIRIWKFSAPFIILPLTYCHIYQRWCGVTNNSTTRVRFGYRIYSLWRFITTNRLQLQWEHLHTGTGSFLDPTDGTVLRRRLTSRAEHFWLRRLTDDDSLKHWRSLTHSESKDWLTHCCVLPYLYHTGTAQYKPWLCYCWLPCNATIPSGERIHGNIRPRLLGNQHSW